MNLLACGLNDADHYEDALSVQQAELSMLRRLGESEENILIAQNNLANTYQELGRLEESLRVRQEVYSGRLKLLGEAHSLTISAACNYAYSLVTLGRFEEAKSLMRRMVPVARRVLGASHDHTLRMRQVYAGALYENPGATHDDLSEAVTTLEDAARTTQRVFGGAHPHTSAMEQALRNARAALRAREALPSPPPSETV